MRLITAFFRLIRWPNLVFIVITQFLFYYCVILPLIFNSQLQGDFFLYFNSLVLISISSILIAAAGYIINDYFDLSIDKINKPQKLIVEKIIKRRWAIIWHWLLSFVGIVIGLYFFIAHGKWIIALSNIICVTALWFYSATFKKKLLVGNTIISLLTAWVVLVLFMFIVTSPTIFSTYIPSSNFKYNASKFLKITILYSGFAFIISLVREVIKDIEDINGDVKYNCKTMPIVWGIPTTKVFIAVWLIVLMGAIIILQFYAMYLGWWWSVLYNCFTIIIPLFFILQKLYQAQTSTDYNKLSNSVKLVMLSGILSMIFFKIYL